MDSANPLFVMIKFCLDIFDSCTLVIFCMEIIIKWIHNFGEYWNDSWNIFDFVITLMVCHIISVNYPQLNIELNIYLVI